MKRVYQRELVVVKRLVPFFDRGRKGSKGDERGIKRTKGDTLIKIPL